MRPRAPNGFTLLEMLLAISLLSLITASIMGGVHVGRRSWETSRASEALDEVESVIRVTTGLLRGSFLVEANQIRQDFEGPRPVFLGTANEVRFIATSDSGAQWGGLIVTAIGVDSGPDGEALAVWTAPYRPQEGLAIERMAMKKTIVAEGLASLQFSYFGTPMQWPPQPQPQPPVWSDGWRSFSNIPALISVRIVLRRLGRELDANAVVAPH